ncbi:MAG: phosphotransferase, partial [Promethearchaeota archaeon]
YDDPGLHWSNPGIKKVTITTSNNNIELIIKILHEKSKREIWVYRFLSKFENFPIPKVFYTEFNENTNDYILITEFGDGIGEWPFKEPQIILCGKLLARIHSYFYDKITTLPEILFQKSYYQSRHKFKDITVSFLNKLEEKDIKIIEKIYPNLNTLKNAIESLENEFFIIEPFTNWVLIHGAFHPPEIVSKKGASEKIPLGVDWESSRVGHPAEDIVGITGQIIDWGKPHFYPLMINSYLKEMNNHHITIDKQALEKEVIVENIIRGIKDLPFLWGQYLRNRNDCKFSSWIDWFKKSMPKITNRFLNDILNKQWTQV